jgi:hypothetical protein
MNLPKAIENMKKKIQQEAEIERQLLNNLAIAEAQVAEAQVAEQSLDVEYDEDYDNELIFKSIPTMAQRIKTKEENETTKMRDYSINSWNGSPGLKSWGYDDANPEK